MVGVHLSGIGRSLEREYGLPFLYAMRGDVAVPDGALVVGLDNKSVQWLARWAGQYHRAAPKLADCLPQRAQERLKEAININHIPRAVYACLLKDLAARNARLVVFDINFHRERANDVLLADAIGSAGNVLLFERVGTDPEGNPERLRPRQLFTDRALGTMAFHVDSERGEIVTGYVTRWRYFNDLSAMPDKAWSAYTGKPVPVGQPLIQPLWLYGPPLSIPTVPLRDVLDPDTGALPEDLSDTVVFVGSSDPEDAAIDDHFPVPTSGRGNELIGGVELAATAFLNRLHGTLLQRPSEGIEALIVFLVALAGSLCIARLSGRRLWIVIAVLATGYLVLATLVFRFALIWLPVAVPAFLTTLLVALIAISVRYFFARALVTRLAPRQVASMLLDGTDADRRAVRTERATIMFTDLVGSTAMAERLDEIAYTQAVNLYYDMATDVVEEHGGMVVEFMGDGIVAMFSESVTGDDHAARCCASARTLIARMTEANDDKATESALTLRIGINTGLTATGDIGARHRFNFKALGDVVNVAARLEQMGKTVQDPGTHVILISETTQDDAHLPEVDLQALGPITVRGRATAMGVFRLVP